MSVVSKEDLIKRFAEKFTGDTSDEVIQLTEDLTDTLEDFIARVEDKEDWKAKFEENDANWRKKYKDRFLEPSVNEEEIHAQDEDENTNVTFNDLFE